ncbi:MAG: hypothetical protein ACK56E_04245, partial [Planctomyces sp.]
LNLREVLNISDKSNTLVVRRDSGDVVNIGSGWIAATHEIIGAETFRVYKQGAATLKVQVNNVYVVSNLNSSGAGSLHQAIVNANSAAGADEIVFTVAGVIPVSSAYPLPEISGAVLIDGATAPGFNAAPMVEISGSDAGNVSGFVFSAGSAGSALRGLSLVGFARAGVELNAGSLNLQGNWIGVTRGGTAGGNGTAGGGGAAGVIVRGAGAVIGGLQTGEGNLISGNTGHGILVVGGSDAVIQ